MGRSGATSFRPDSEKKGVAGASAVRKIGEEVERRSALSKHKTGSLTLVKTFSSPLVT
jgi:hypothetical protein